MKTSVDIDKPVDYNALKAKIREIGIPRYVGNNQRISRDAGFIDSLRDAGLDHIAAVFKFYRDKQGDKNLANDPRLAWARKVLHTIDLLVSSHEKLLKDPNAKNELFTIIETAIAFGNLHGLTKFDVRHLDDFSGKQLIAELAELGSKKAKVWDTSKKSHTRFGHEFPPGLKMPKAA